MKSSDIEQPMTQDDSQSYAQLPSAIGQRRCLSPMTFSQKFYQSKALEIAEEYEQAINANSLEKIKILLDKVLELDEGL